ncbi:NF-X1-type zinc finger protein NFXL1 [Diachasma alloeum]|uniref:NF-X1-type zinc finger protein NFXL1 n=1 Tax=Diachasma alloeum TaxID=454923 RepID=UPI00073829DB|nr:NF-X1-type zinc finger protein NFXL1 [Diachasma alloeum]
MRKFKRAQAQNQASIERHLNGNVLESSSDEENESSHQSLQQAVSKTLSSYEFEGGDTEKTLSYLTDLFQSGGAVCLICISSVKKSDPIWSCSTCYSFLHLTCIQHWIRDSLASKLSKGITPVWACPKCRTEYPESSTPTSYLCFCLKTKDPVPQPWIIPHSCEEKCSKPLSPACGHTCMLLCHPGPCPPCPKMVTTTCHCGKQPPQARRCSTKSWSCRTPCNKALPCRHPCRIECHTGACPPCPEIVPSPCHCGASTKPLECSETTWSCTRKCTTQLNCKIHTCEGFCHVPGDCGDCPVAKNRTCPCGKKRYNVSCKQKTLPTCGDTCGKLLDCGTHLCNMRCHLGDCGQCLEVVSKTCKCSSYTKEISCTKEFHCNKKCTNMRACGKHPCNKKCCDCVRTGVNPCEKICETSLNCRKHKCTAPCHSGPCYPCPRTITFQCRCGNSKIEVPCGTKKRIKPPHCNKLCKIPPICHHSKQESHKCHQGSCPPCKKICHLVYKRCGHECVAVCHTKVWVKVRVNGVAQPAGPWEISKDRMELKTLPCPPCEVSVMVTCLGGHETRPWPCHIAIPGSCGRECGRGLPCGNHKCEVLCHRVRGEGGGDGEDCMECEEPCRLGRPEGCSHLCPERCHPAPCPPCKQPVKIACHCGLNSLYKRCVEVTGKKGRDREEMLKCGNQCPRNYSCGHRCIDNCHPGSCRPSDVCNKRMKITCKCQRIKKTVLCTEVQRGNVKIECDQQCKELKQQKERAQAVELAKKKKEEELKNQREVEKFERKFKPRRKGKERAESVESSGNNNYMYIIRGLYFAVVCIIVAIVTFYMTERM